MTSDVYVEQCEVELGVLRQDLCLVNSACPGDNAMSERFDHLGDHHPNDWFVLNQEDQSLSWL